MALLADGHSAGATSWSSWPTEALHFDGGFGGVVAVKMCHSVILLQGV